MFVTLVVKMSATTTTPSTVGNKMFSILVVLIGLVVPGVRVQQLPWDYMNPAINPLCYPPYGDGWGGGWGGGGNGNGYPNGWGGGGNGGGGWGGGYEFPNYPIRKPEGVCKLFRVIMCLGWVLRCLF